MRYFLEIAYDGSDFNGWQIQPKASTVQEAMNSAISTILNSTTKTIGCGRTDTGVHAKQFYLHFDTNTNIPKNFIYRLNNFLPKAIAVKEIYSVEPTAHSRFDATSRTYQYFLHFNKNPFKSKFSFHYTSSPHIGKMNAAAKMLTKYEDFKVLSKTGSDNKTTLCSIEKTEWRIQEGQDSMLFQITADRFLRGMVRLITGALLMIGTGKLTIDELERSLQTGERLKYIRQVPPNGLFLSEVTYPYI